MAFPLSIEVDSLPARGHSSTLRFTRRRNLRRRHNPNVDAAWTVKVSGYHSHHRDTTTLIDGISHERQQVMVVPSATPPVLARRALRIAAVHADPIQGTDLLALAPAEARLAVVTG